MARSNSVSMGRALNWYGDGWRIFKTSPLALIGSLIVYVVIMLVLSIIPLGSLVAAILSPALMAGLFLLAERAYREEDATLGSMFEPLQNANPRNPLLILGVLSFVLVFVLVLIGALFFGAAAITQSLASGGSSNPQAAADLFSSGGAIIGMLIIILGSIGVGMGLFYAPPLILFQEVRPWSAIKLSLRGCLRNILPLLVFGIIAALLTVLAMLPLGLGMLVLGPVMLGAGYSSYLDIFETDLDTDPAADATSVPRIKTVDRS